MADKGYVEPGMKTGVTQEDLNWWLEFVNGLKWTFAKTYADTAPHEYVTSIGGKTDGLTKEDCIRAGKVIRTFGRPMNYYSSVNTYLEDPASGLRYWSMDEKVTDTDLINRCDLNLLYGDQTAPSTVIPNTFTLYDELSADYDSLWQDQEDKEEELEIRRRMIAYFGGIAPTTLDVGCGTGLLLNLGVPSRYAYTGIDPSQGMLNELVRKYKKVQQLYPGTAEEILPTLRGQKFQLVASLFAAVSYLEVESIKQMQEMTSELLVLMAYEEGYLPDYYAEKGLDEPSTSKAAREEVIRIGKSPGGELVKIGKFDVALWSPRRG